MIFPTIHLNGTSKRELYLAYYAAHNAVQDAINSLATTAPHGRDYYPQGDNMIYSAAKDHAARMVALNNVLKELEELTLHCMP